MRIAEIFRSLQGEGRLTGIDSVFVRTSGCNLRCGFCDTPYASWTPEGDDLSVDEILDRANAAYESQRLPAKIGVNGIKSRIEDSESRVRGSGDNVRDILPTLAHCPAATIRHAMPTVQRPRPAAHNLQPTAYSKHAVLTGGEPMLFSELIPLSAALHRDCWHITIETSGTLYLPVECDLMSISPKLSNSTPSPEQNPRWTWRHESNRHAPDIVSRLIAQYEYQIKFVIDYPADCAEVEGYLESMPDIDRARVMLMPQGVDPEELAEKSRWLKPYCAEHGLIFCPRRQVDWFGPGRGK
jgi:7-carboxy-7-deazaguanine synthase